MLKSVGRDRRSAIYHPESASRWAMLKREAIMFFIDNDAYGFIYVNAQWFRCIQLLVGPLILAIIAYRMGYPFMASHSLGTCLFWLIRAFIVSTRPPDILSKSELANLTLTTRSVISHDTVRLTFKWKGQGRLGLGPVQHVQIVALKADCPEPTEVGKWNGIDDDETDTVERKFTPIKVDDWNGEMDLVVKIYRPNETFPDGGRLTRYLDRLKVGDTIAVKGPYGRYRYMPGAVFKEEMSLKVYNKITKVNLLAGGSGITPVLQLGCGILDDIYTYNNHIQISIISCNKTTDDILCEKEMEQLQNAHQDQLHIHYVVDKLDDRDGDKNFKGSVGYISEDIIKNHFAPPDEDVLVFVCGPPGMKAVAKKILTELNYKLIWGI